MKVSTLLIGILCLVVIHSVRSEAQNKVPKYKYTSYTGNGAAGGPDFHSQGAPKSQYIYLKTDFPGMPEGYPTAVYLMVGQTYSQFTPNPTVWDSMRIRMGYTKDAAFTHYTPNKSHDSFCTGLTTVFMQPKFSVYGADTIGTWVRFPMDQQANFTYSRAQNLVVDISRAYRASMTAYGHDWMASNLGLNRSLSGWYDSARTPTFALPYVLDIGFDFPTSGVSGTGNKEQLSGFYCYPNPAPGGRFTAGFEQRGDEALLTVADMAGHTVWQARQSAAGPGLMARNIDLSALPKGCYLVRVSTAEGSASRMVRVE